ncbi:hypothetical protein HY36_11545 [Hyphomonas atlantica]|uniref:ABC transporter domain-containing protein n=2 Tax=Hyphomonas atlantica TaxID=1280948 RepID=A0A059DWL7_9PROT|nr:hypothetical protein HY36_11545 [Hyphomonas atlantica]
MVSIVAQNVSVVFPMVGSDVRHGMKLKKQTERRGTQLGGKIILEDNRPAGILALDRLNLVAKPGDRIGLFGPNGSGKSTALRVLGGIYPPTAGHIEVNGKVSAMFSLNLGVNQEATGLENIELKGILHGLRREEIRELVPEIVDFSELGDYIHLPVKTYSSGMKMRLLFSIASAFRPDILLLDEWVSTGDKRFRRKVAQRMETILDQTPIVIVASHDHRRISSWANKIIQMKRGHAQMLDPVAFSEWQAWKEWKRGKKNRKKKKALQDS